MMRKTTYALLLTTAILACLLTTITADCKIHKFLSATQSEVFLLAEPQMTYYLDEPHGFLFVSTNDDISKLMEIRKTITKTQKLKEFSIIPDFNNLDTAIELFDELCKDNDLKIHLLVGNEYLPGKVQSYAQLEMYEGKLKNVCEELHPWTLKGLGALFINRYPAYINGRIDMSSVKNYYDSTKIKNYRIKGQPANHFVLTGRYELSLSYGCERSFYINKANVLKYNELSESPLKFNLHAETCSGITSTTAFLHNYVNKFGEPDLYYRNSINCQQFNEKLANFKSKQVKLKLPSGSGWVRMNEDILINTDFDDYEGYIWINFGFTLVRDYNILSLHKVLWYDGTKDKPTCFGTCYFIEVRRTIGVTNEDFVIHMNHMYEQLRILNADYTPTKKHSEKVKYTEQNNAILNVQEESKQTFHQNVSYYGTFSTTNFPNGVLTSNHFDPYGRYNAIEMLPSNNVYDLTHVNEVKDYRIYGDIPKLDTPTFKNYYIVKKTRYEAYFIGCGKDFFYFATFAKAVKGMSGAPIYNDRNKVITIYDKSISKNIDSTSMVSLNDDNDITIHRPVILKSPRIVDVTPNHLPIFESKPITLENSMELPIRSGSYFLPDSQNRSKLCDLAIKSINQGYKTLVVEPYKSFSPYTTALISAQSDNDNFLSVESSDILVDKTKNRDLNYFSQFDVIITMGNIKKSAHHRFLSTWLTKMNKELNNILIINPDKAVNSKAYYNQMLEKANNKLVHEIKFDTTKNYIIFYQGDVEQLKQQLNACNEKTMIYHDMTSKNFEISSKDIIMTSSRHSGGNVVIVDFLNELTLFPNFHALINIATVECEDTLMSNGKVQITHAREEAWIDQNQYSQYTTQEDFLFTQVKLTHDRSSGFTEDLKFHFFEEVVFGSNNNKYVQTFRAKCMVNYDEQNALLWQAAKSNKPLSVLYKKNAQNDNLNDSASDHSLSSVSKNNSKKKMNKYLEQFINSFIIFNFAHWLFYRSRSYNDFNTTKSKIAIDNIVQCYNSDVSDPIEVQVHKMNSQYVVKFMDDQFNVVRTKIFAPNAVESVGKIYEASLIEADSNFCKY